MNSDEGNIPTSNFTEAGTIDENGRPERTILSNSLIGRNDALFNVNIVQLFKRLIQLLTHTSHVRLIAPILRQLQFEKIPSMMRVDTLDEACSPATDWMVMMVMFSMYVCFS